MCIMSTLSVYSKLLLLLACLSGCGLKMCRGCREEERTALLEIKDSINNPVGTAFPNWYGQDCCQWEGVECNVSTYRILKIRISHQRDESLNENWYPNATSFSQFLDLQELHLTGNRIGGFISPNDLDKLKNLQKLDLQRNSIAAGSSLCWGKMRSLSYLDLSRNKLQGLFPKCLCKSHSLTQLKLSHNQLHGDIDSCLSSMSFLKHLDLSDNQFNGSFPSSIFRNLTRVELLVASQNLFNGMISLSVLANLSKLTYLDISKNEHLKVETEFPTWSPSFQLDGLFLSGCNLNNHSGNKIPSFMSMQYHLQFVDLSHNGLVGRIPSWLLNNVTSSLSLRGNNFSGLFPLPYQNQSSQLTSLDISDNQLDGPIPANINFILPRLIRLHASMNSFEGSIPLSFPEMWKRLQDVDLSRNQLHGEIPFPSSNSSNMFSMEHLDLSENNFQGEVLPRNSSMPNLRWLSLQGNSFTRISPESLSNCCSLQLLDISNNKLCGELSTQLPVLPDLRILVLRGNCFEGRMPLQLCRMTKLRILDISNNYLSGDIPSCINNISSWTQFDSDTSLEVQYVSEDRYAFLTTISGIDMSGNQLTGTIPVEMGELRNIRFLNISKNLLTGQIPASLKNLAELESLDLSHNRLFGAIPQELSNLTFLGFLNLSVNNLSGMVPQGKQFDTFENSSYTGNLRLCGFPLSRKCNYEDAEKSPYGHSSKATKCSTCVFWCFSFLLYSVLIIIHASFHPD